MQRRPLGLVLALAVSLIGGTASIATAAPITPVNAQHINVGLAPAKVTKKTTANLNLRKSANTKAASWLVIPKNTTLTILKTSGKWSQVSYKSKTGWVSNDYLSTSVAKPAAGKTYNYTKSFVALKASASAGSKTLLDLQRRTKVEVTGKSGSWVKIVASGKTGFVPATALDKSNPAATYRWSNGNQKAYASNKTTAKVLTTLSNNTRVEWLRTSGSWQQVKTSAGIAWVPSKNLATKEIKPAPKVYNFTKSYVDVKTTAVSSSKTVVSIHRQSKVEVLGKSGSWVKIAVSGKTGFVPASTLQTSNPAAVYRWANGSQKVYKSTNTNSQSITTLKHNTKITWLRTSGSWQQVRTSAGVGWVPSKNLATQEIKPAPKVYNFTKSYVDVKTTAASSSKTVISIHRQSKVEVLGKSGSWVKIVVSGRTGFVPASTLQASNPAVINRWVKGSQRVFASASTSAKSIATLPQNTKIEWLRTSGSWQQVKTSAGIGWIQTVNLSTAFINPPAPKFDSARWTTANLNIRQAGSSTAASLGVIPAGEKVMMATTVSGWAHVKSSKGTGWASTAFLSTSPLSSDKNEPETENKPAGTQYRWTKANLNLRVSNSATATVINVVPMGEKITYLEAKSGWARVKTSVGTGWVSEDYLSTSVVTPPPPVGQLQPDTLAVIDAVKARYGKYVSSFGGIRSGSTGHSTGKATDIMIKDYKNPVSISNGDEIVDFLIRNQKELGISYIIWQDKIWLGNYLGWQEYSTSGKYGTQFAGNWNDTTKHLDHIHAETYGNQATGGPLK